MSSFVKASGGITPNSADPGEEFPFLHTISVVDRVVSVDKPELVQNNIKTETVTLNLDSEWEGLSTVINIGNEKPVSVIWSGEPVVIPAELMTTVGSLDVSVVGYGDDGGIRAVTKKATSIFNVVASGFVEGDEAVPDPTTILGQLTEAADRANQAADRFNQASEDIGDISDAVTEVKGYAGAAKTSETNAASSATAASRSETNAAASASAAKVSETNAAASATAAQQAVDGFGLEVGTTTTTDPGTDAVVEIQKAGTKYTANFTIPRGDVGPAGVNENVPLGSTSGVVAQGTDAYPTLPRKVQVHGRTIENLCPAFNNVNNGVTFSTDANGYISIKGTATDAIYEQPSIVNLPQNTKVWIYVDSDFKAKGIRNIYAQSSGGWSLYASNTEVMSSTTSSATSGSLVISIDSGVTVDTKIRVMFVASETEPDNHLFVPSGVHAVEPTKLIVAGKNLIPIGNISSGSYKGINWKANDDKTFTISGTPTNTVDIPFILSDSMWSLPKGRYTVKAIGDLQNNIKVFIRQVKDWAWRMFLNEKEPVKNIDIDEDIVLAECSVRIPSGVTLENSVYGIQIELGDSNTSYEAPNIKSLDFTQSISLSDGDTLTIDRDGTTRIIHAEGEPTVLDNVTLSELPAPTFNVYTAGGYIQPTVDVGYEQDVNLVLQALEAKIASLEVTQTIMKGA